MPNFVVHLIDAQRGESRLGVSAADEQAAVAALRIDPSRVLSVNLNTQDIPTAPLRAKHRPFPLRLFSQELAVLLAAGIPLLEALVTLREKELSGAVAQALDSVIDLLKTGQSFSTALKSQPDSFDPLFIAVVQSSEQIGQTEQALREHAAYLGWVDALRDKLVSASIYPLTLIVAGAAVIVFLLLFVVPRFAGILEGVGGEMPAASQMLIDIGRLSGAHPWPPLQQHWCC